MSTPTAAEVVALSKAWNVAQEAARGPLASAATYMAEEDAWDAYGIAFDALREATT
jgi:hypothetical protein